MNILRYHLITLILISSSHPVFSSVSYSTGQLSFSRPLVTAQGHSLSLPVSLSYNSHVTKNQKASWVGLGFDLDMPYIERTIIGAPDDQWGSSLDYSTLPTATLQNMTVNGIAPGVRHFSYYTYQPMVYKENVNGLVYFRNTISGPTTGAPCYTQDPNTKVISLDPACRYFNNQTQQDIYSLRNFPAGDKRIFFSQEYQNAILQNSTNRNGDSLFACVAPYSPWKVSYIIDNPSGAGQKIAEIKKWIIVDDAGNEYVFDKTVKIAANPKLYEQAKVVYDKVDDGQWNQRFSLFEKHFNGEATIRWYLTKMSSFNHESINIQYEDCGQNIALNESPYFGDIISTEKTVAPAMNGNPPVWVKVEGADTMQILNALRQQQSPKFQGLTEIPRARAVFDIEINDFVMSRNLVALALYKILRVHTNACDQFGYLYQDYEGRDQSHEGHPKQNAKTIWDYAIAGEMGTLLGLIGSLGIYQDYVYSLAENSNAEFRVHFTDQTTGNSGFLAFSAVHEWQLSHCDNTVVSSKHIEYKNGESIYALENLCKSGISGFPNMNFPGADPVCGWDGANCQDGNSYDIPIFPIPDDFSNDFDNLHFAYGWSGLIFHDTIEFKGATRINGVSISLQGSDKCYALIDVQNLYFDIEKDGSGSLDGNINLGETVYFNSYVDNGFERKNVWSTDRMRCGSEYKPFTSDWVQNQNNACYGPMRLSIYSNHYAYDPANVPNMSAYRAGFGNEQGMIITWNESEHQSVLHDYYMVLQDPGSQQHHYSTYTVVAKDESKTFKNAIYPSRITTDLQTVDFGVSEGRTDQDATGRPVLQSLSATDNSTGAKLAKVLFNYGKSCIDNNKLQLNDICEQRTSGAGGTKLLYHFGYETNPSGALPQDVNFGSVNKGMINSITDVNGGTTSYEYEQGKYKYVSNGVAKTTEIPAGFRIKKVTSSGEGVTAPVIQDITYYDGEITYADAVSSGLYREVLTGFPDFTGYNVCMPQCIVNYGKVSVKQHGVKGRTEYTYVTPRNATTYNYPNPLVDGQDEYRRNQIYRNALAEIATYKDGAAENDKLTSSVSHYDIRNPDFADTTLIGASLVPIPAGDKDRFRFNKPLTHLGIFRLDNADGTFRNKLPDLNTNTDLEASMLVESNILVTTYAIATTQKASKYNSFEYDGKGQLTVSRDYKGDSKASEIFSTYSEYAYRQWGLIEDPELKSGNLLTLVSSQKRKYRTPMGEYLTGINWNIWKQGPPITGYSRGGYYQDQTYLWNEKLDADGLPALSTLYGYTMLFDPHNKRPLPNGTRYWAFGDSVLLRNAHGKPLCTIGAKRDKTNPGKGPIASFFYRSGNELPIGTVVNANNREAGLYTGDYDRNTTSQGTVFLDLDNAWEKRDENPNQLSHSVNVETPTQKHFGEKRLHILNAVGPTRSSRIEQGRDYIASAWVRIKHNSQISDNHVTLYGDYRKVINNTDFPNFRSFVSPDAIKPFGGAASVQSRNESWKYIELRIPASTDLSPSDWGPGAAWFARIHVSTETGGDAYIEDVRFYPADAYAATVFYDSRNRRICAVDAHNRASYTVYDSWDVPVQSKNHAGKLLSRSAYSVAGDQLNVAANDVRILSQNLSGTFHTGRKMHITWIAGNPSPGTVKAYLAGAGGETLLATITTSDAAWSDFEWTVAGASGNYTVRLKNASNELLDESTAFAIAQ